MEPRNTFLKSLYRPARFFFSTLTLQLIWFDLMRLKARLKHWGRKDVMPIRSKLHFGCGNRLIQGWLNVDITQSDYDVDLAAGCLPWADEVFDVVVSQQVIEHLELREELIPLLHELHRVLKHEGEIWLSCPDIKKVCLSYLQHGMKDFLVDRKTRDPNYSLGNIPSQHMINDLFHQFGQHKNLYDFTILEWTLTSTGFTKVIRISESDLLSRFPEFPPRNDDFHSIYVQARKL